MVVETAAPPYPNIAVVSLFAALAFFAENAQVDLPTSITISPHVLLVLATLTSLDGHGALLGTTICGAAGGIVVRFLRRRYFAIVIFNIAQFGLAAAAASGTAWLCAHNGVPSLQTYLIAPLAYVAVNSSLCVVGAMTDSGMSGRELWLDVRSTIPIDLLMGIAGVLLGRLYVEVSPLATFAIIAPAIVARSALGYVVNAQGAHRRLEVLYGFTQRLEGSRDEQPTVAAVLEQLRSLLRAEVAEVTLLGRDEWRRTASNDEPAVLANTTGVGRPTEAEAMVAGPLLLEGLAPTSPVRRDLGERGITDAMIAPLRVGDALIGTVTVANRAGGATFRGEDLRMLETLATHAAISLGNARLVEQLRWESRTDRLTGLPNRDRFNELVAEAEKPCSVLLLDLDRFKEINDTLGHGAGDDLLRSVAHRLAERLEPAAIVARLGGDEFGVLMGGGDRDATQLSMAILRALEDPFRVGELELEITASIGAATSAGDEDAVLLLQQADVAMYSAKRTRSGWETYSAERDPNSPRRLALAGELRRAIESSVLEVYFQPKARLGPGDISGVEALVRWQHPRYGLLAPDSFVPVAERAGLIRPMTLLVLGKAAAQHRELRKAGYHLSIAVNLSVRSVLDVELPDQVARVIEGHGMDPADLTLEITEGSVMADPARTIGVLSRLAALGVGISLDDFGTGYSSLAYLRRLPATEVKIDRSFITGMLSGEKDEAIVHSTIDLGHSLGLRVVAEGVEDGGQYRRLAQLNCDEAQGFYISPALPAKDLVPWLNRRPRVHDRQT